MTLEVTEETFQAEVLLAEVPTVVAFWAVWCRPCRVVDRQLELLREHHPEISVVRVNVDENEGLVERYQIMTVPSVLLFRNGQVTGATSGLMPEEFLAIELGITTDQEVSHRFHEHSAEEGRC